MKKKSTAIEMLKEAVSDLQGHLVPLQGKQWTLWRNAALRGAGFPARLVLSLASEPAAAAADAVAEAEEQLQQLWPDLFKEVNRALDSLAESGDWDDKEKRKPLLKALSSLRKGKLPARAESVLGTALTQRARLLQERVEEASSRYPKAYEKAVARQSEALHEIASLARFREAVLWQNREAYQTGLRKIAERHPSSVSRDSKRRQHEELAANYLQRYAVKNETIGFFGPVSVVQFSDRQERVEVHPGRGLLAERGVYLEAWSVLELATALAGRREVKPWLRPRRMPFAQVRDQTLYIPFSKPEPLPAPVAAVLKGCDGQRTARGIVADLAAEQSNDGQAEQAYAILAGLSEKGLVEWNFNVPVSPFALDILREQMEDIEDADVRQLCLRAVQELESARRRVAAASGKPDELDQALRRLNQTFTKLTGKESTRREGKAYAARTLAYEDCRRDLEMEIGAELRRNMGKPLALILQSARWFEWKAAQAFRQTAQAITPLEPKPFYADFNSPIFVDILAGAFRRVQSSDEAECTVRITEMLPTPHQAWLPDSQGNRYTSELRMVVTDRSAGKGDRPPAIPPGVG